MLSDAYNCVSKYGHIIGLNNGLSPILCQAIIWTNAVAYCYTGNRFQWILIKIHTLSFNKLNLKMLSDI